MMYVLVCNRCRLATELYVRYEQLPHPEGAPTVLLARTTPVEASVKVI